MRLASVVDDQLSRQRIQHYRPGPHDQPSSHVQRPLSKFLNAEAIDGTPFLMGSQPLDSLRGAHDVARQPRMRLQHAALYSQRRTGINHSSVIYRDLHLECFNIFRLHVPAFLVPRLSPPREQIMR